MRDIKILKFSPHWGELQIKLFTQTIADKIYETMSKNQDKPDMVINI